MAYGRRAMPQVDIVIRSDDIGSVGGVITTDQNPKTAELILKALPIQARGNRWGDEIYFSIPVRCEEENSSEAVERGDIAYWPPGSAFCIFFGRTPASTADQIRPASAVNVVGRVTGDISVLRRFTSGSGITVERVR